MVNLAKEKTRKKYEGQINDLEGIYSPDPKFGATATGATAAAKKTVQNFAPTPPPPKSIAEQFLEFKKSEAGKGK